MVECLEVLHAGVEDAKDGVNSFQVVLFEGLELLLGLEKVNKLLESSLEEVKASEDLLGVEVELSSLGHAFKTLLGELVLGNIGFMELEALLKNHDEILSGYDLLIPEDAVITS